MKTRKMREVEAALQEPLRGFLHRRYVDEGATITEISKELGISHTTVWAWLLAFNIPRRTWQLPPEAEDVGPVETPSAPADSVVILPGKTVGEG